MSANRKVCFTGPMRLNLIGELLRDAGCELVLGKNTEDFRTHKYDRGELIDLIGDCPVIYPSGRGVIGADVLDSCPELGSSEAGQRMAAQSILSILEGKVPDTVVNPDAIDPWRQRFWS